MANALLLSFCVATYGRHNAKMLFGYGGINGRASPSDLVHRYV